MFHGNGRQLLESVSGGQIDVAVGVLDAIYSRKHSSMRVHQ